MAAKSVTDILSTGPPLGLPDCRTFSDVVPCHGFHAQPLVDSGSDMNMFSDDAAQCSTTSSRSVSAKSCKIPGDSSQCSLAWKCSRYWVVQSRRAGGMRVPGSRGTSFWRRLGSKPRSVLRRSRAQFLLALRTNMQSESCLSAHTYNAAVSLLGGGAAAGADSDNSKKDKQTSKRDQAFHDALFHALTEVSDKFTRSAKSGEDSDRSNGNKGKGKGKQSLREALAKLLERPPAGRALLDKLNAVLRAAKGGHLLLEDGPGSEARDQGSPSPAPQHKAKSAAKPILKKPPAPLTEAASARAPLGGFALRDEDWPNVVLLKQASVLAKLQRGDLPHSGPVAAIMTEEAAEEAAALWNEHALSEKGGLTCVIACRSASEVAWVPRRGLTLQSQSQWLGLKHNDQVVLRSVSLAVLGKGVSPKSPVINKPREAKIPEKIEMHTVRLTVYAKYMAEKLTTQLADSFLKQVWPEDDKKARNFAAWRPETSSGKEVALVSYCTCSSSTASVLLGKSGQTPLFVSRLAKDKKKDPEVHARWVDRPSDSSDFEYWLHACNVLKQSGATTGLIHRLGGGRDLGFEQKGLDPKTSAPFYWLATCPPFWAAQDLLNVLTSVGWDNPEVLGQSGKSWRFRAKARPTKETTFVYELADDVTLKIVPQPRRLDIHNEYGKPLARPKVPWTTPPTTTIEVPDTQLDEPMMDGASPDSTTTAHVADGEEKNKVKQHGAKPQGAEPPCKKARSTRAFGCEEVIQDPTCPLKGWTVIETGADGKCGYHSLVGATYLAGKFDMQLDEKYVSKDAGSLRVKTAEWLFQDSARFKKSWAVDSDHPEHTGNSWDEYLKLVAKPDFWLDELQMRAAAERLKKRVLVHYLDTSKKWARRVINSRAEGEPLVLLLRDQHFRPVRPVGKGFPPEWLRNVGAQMPHRGRGGGPGKCSGIIRLRDAPGILRSSSKKSKQSSTPSCSTFRVGRAGSSSKKATSVSTFRVGGPGDARETSSNAPSMKSCSTFKVGASSPSGGGRLDAVIRRGLAAAAQFQQGSYKAVPTDKGSSSSSSSNGQVWTKDGIYKCTCGWSLPEAAALIPKQEQNRRLHDARMHWSQCHPGEPFPKLTKEQHKQKTQNMADKAAVA